MAAKPAGFRTSLSAGHGAPRRVWNGPLRVLWLADKLGMRTRGGMANGIYLAGKRIDENGKTRSLWNKLENKI